MGNLFKTIYFAIAGTILGVVFTILKLFNKD